MSDKKYCGSGKEFGKYGDINVTINLSDITKDMITEYEGKKYLRVVVSKKREKDKFGKTHSVYLNEWKPDNRETATEPDNSNSDEPNNDLPF